MVPHVILGTGIAGTVALEAIRARDRRTPVVVVGPERELPYTRVNIPGLVAQEVGRDDLYLRGPDFYKTLGATILSGRQAVAVDPGAHQVTLDNGETIVYRTLLVATGSAPVRPPVPGLDLEGVHTFWTLADAEAIAGTAGHARRAVVIGGGFIGLKAAMALRKRGLAVTVVEKMPRLLPGQLDDIASTIVAEQLRGAGIDVLLNEGLVAITGNRRAEGASLVGAGHLECQLVVIAAGVRPEVGFLAGSGVAVGQGVIVDECLRSSVPDVYAAGDSAEVPTLNDGAGVIALWPAAREQGLIAGHNMSGFPLAYRGGMARNSMSIYGLRLISIGDIHAVPADGTVTLTWRAAGSYRRLLMEKDILRGALLVGDVNGAGVLGALIASRRPLSQGAGALARLGPSFARAIEAL